MNQTSTNSKEPRHLSISQTQRLLEYFLSQRLQVINGVEASHEGNHSFDDFNGRVLKSEYKDVHENRSQIISKHSFSLHSVANRRCCFNVPSVPELEPDIYAGRDLSDHPPSRCDSLQTTNNPLLPLSEFDHDTDLSAENVSCWSFRPTQYSSKVNQKHEFFSAAREGQVGDEH